MVDRVWVADVVTHRYKCCFCGRTIDPVSPDVGGLLYTMKIDRPEDEHRHQQLFCHTLCLMERLDRAVKLLVLDMD